MPSKHLIGRNIKNNIANNVKQEEIEEKDLTTEKFNEQLQNDKINNINIQSNPQNSSESEHDKTENQENFTKNIEEGQLNTKILERKLAEEDEDIQPSIARSNESSEKIQDFEKEKKPVLAVKGVSVLSTTPATQRRRPSTSNCSTNIVSPSTDQNISADSSLVEQQKRNRENVAVGVVSPMLQKHENNFILNNDQDRTLDNVDTIIDNTMGIPLVEEKEEPLKFKEKINNNEEKNNIKQKSSSTSYSTNNQEDSSKRDEKKILTEKPSNLNKILLPSTSTTKIGKIKTKENNLTTKTTKILPKGNEKIIREEEECPQSPLMPPPLAPTKLSLPCISSSSSSSSPNEEEVLTKNLHQNQQQIQHFRLAITAASNDSTTSQDSLDSVRTAIHCPNKELNNSKQQMPQKIKQLESIPGPSGEILRENSEILTLKRRENEQTNEKVNKQIGLINNKQVIERLSEPRKITSDTNNSTRHSSTTISSMLKSDGTKNYRYAKDDCINL
uniref:Uncharacterized protein n=1 Tax=Meloidogyne javanica TaxID=6303 RepID=A0A915N8T5_MELJA